MSFVCDQPAIFKNGVSLSNVVGTTHMNGRLNVNSSIEAQDIIVKDDLVVQSLNILDKINDLSIIDDSLNILSTKPLQNSVITNALSTKQDLIVDLSTNGLLKAGENISFDICYNNITINSSSISPPVYFVCYVSPSSVVNNVRIPRFLVFDQIARENPSSSILNGGYVIQETGVYWIHSSILGTEGGYSIYLTRNSITTDIHHFSGSSIEDNSIIYECNIGDLIQVAQIQSFISPLTYYGSGDTTGLNLVSTLQGYKL